MDIWNLTSDPVPRWLDIIHLKIEPASINNSRVIAKCLTCYGFFTIWSIFKLFKHVTRIYIFTLEWGGGRGEKKLQVILLHSMFQTIIKNQLKDLVQKLLILWYYHNH